MNRKLFEHLVAEALDDLPEAFQEKLDNVEVLVEDWPDQETLRLAGMRSRGDLMGFYHGVPQPARAHNYGLVLPDRISIYQYPIESCCHTLEQVRALVSRVVRHEIAHHFGLDDEHLRDIGAY
jgi:predicted Zn-dependent protease with MMP-like domain